MLIYMEVEEREGKNMISYDIWKTYRTVDVHEQYDILRMARDIMMSKELSNPQLDYHINELANMIDILKELDEE